MELRPYQEEDSQFLLKHKSAACFNDMRTGKTPTSLVTLAKHGSTRNLIICTASAIFQWKEEYERWLGKPCVAITGRPAQRHDLLTNWKHGLVVSYDTFKATSRSNGMLDDILSYEPTAIIIDEAHRIKDPKSATAKAIFKTKNIPIKLALTGTPAPNKPYEIYSILHWLFPTEFKSYWGFINEYFKQEAQFAAGRTFIEIGDFLPSKQQALQQRLSEFATQRKRKEVMAWLPEKDYQKIFLEPTKPQIKYLTELQKFFETGDVVTQGHLDRLIRYRQICLHPQLIDLPGTSPKLDWLGAYLRDCPETPTIIFSKFTSFLKIILKELYLQNYGVIIGETPIEERNKIKHAFQKGDLNLLLINIDAGKEALTLDRAEAIIFTDKFPPVGDILQAEDRFVATTEDRANKPHVIYELILKDTYDEQLYTLIEQRLTAVDVINDFKKYLTFGRR